LKDLINRFKSGEQRALARLISKLENEAPDKEEILKKLYYLTGNAKILGVTGSPGAGKSSLVDQLTKLIRKRGETVGIIAVDPSSPFSGGALLGDRIRMGEHATDRGVFIRSMGTRGSLGGLAKTSKEVVMAMDAFGMDWVIVETVGVGQAELDIMHVANTVMVVLTPGAGDAIQTLKAGIMEIADIFAVNKCDLPGADKIANDVNIMLDQQCDKMDWRPPVIQVSTLKNIGLTELLDSVYEHYQYLKDNNKLEEKRRERAKAETLEMVDYRWHQLVKEHTNYPGKVNELLEKVANMDMNPYEAASSILEHVTANFDLNKLGNQG